MLKPAPKIRDEAVDDPKESISPDGLDFRQSVIWWREKLHPLLLKGEAIEQFNPDGFRPSDVNAFAFVGRLPKRQSNNFYRCSYYEKNKKFGVGRILLSGKDLKLRLIGDDCWKHHIEKDRYVKELEEDRAYRIRTIFMEMRSLLLPEIDGSSVLDLCSLPEAVRFMNYSAVQRPKVEL